MTLGNHDSHAKNLAMLATSTGLRLAPFYDLMSTRVYAGLGSNFAFSIGGEFEPGKMTGEHLAELSSSLGVVPRYASKLARELAGQVDRAIVLARDQMGDEDLRLLANETATSLGLNSAP